MTVLHNTTSDPPMDPPAAETAERKQADVHSSTLAALLSGMAHELNNPINTVLNFAQLMLMDARSDDDREALEVIQRETERAAAAVADLRAVARQIASAGAPREAVDLNEVVRNALKLRRYPCRSGGVEASVELGARLPTVSIPRARLEQALLALMLHMEREGARRRLWVSTYAAAGGVTLELADVEPYLSRAPQHRDPAPERAHEAVWQLARSIARDGVAEARVESRDGGVVVTLHFAVAGAPADGKSAPASAAPQPCPLRVLVVDDEDSIRCSIQRFLERRGHRVDVAGDGLEALELLQARRDGDAYDVILSDLRMPGFGGKQLLSCLQQRGDGLDSRVVFMTGDALSSDAAWVMESTGAPALHKPVDLYEIARILESFHAGGAAGA